MKIIMHTWEQISISQRYKTVIFFFITFFTIGSLYIPLLLHASSENEYVGAKACRTCHEEQYNAWKSTGHAKMLRTISDIAFWDISFPEGYTRKDISYVIGGNTWKTLFLDSNGYLITSTSAGEGKNQYNLKSGQWVDYRPGEQIPYNCGKCHTTGFTADGHQNGHIGIEGTWKFDGVQCEACHGPGKKHSQSLLKDDIVIDGNGCFQCHGIEPFEEIPLNGVFLARYSEANQLRNSLMKNLMCTSCHNPHLRSEQSIIRPCESCHRDTAEIYRRSFKYRSGITCSDCHMPPAEVIAEGNPEVFRGDFKSHLFRIDHSKKFTVLEKEGQRINPGYLTVDYSCTPCHNIYRDRQWAAGNAMFAHRIQVTSNIKIMKLQAVTMYTGFLSALIALLTGLYLKNYFLSAIKLNKKKVLTYHRLTSWIAFSIFIFNAIVCTYFHFPLDDLPKALHYGWFLIHPINGLIGVCMYTGKIIAVRKLKKGWKTDGLMWGIGTFVFWLVQFMTVILH